MNFDKQYYILEREDNDNYPLLEWDELANVTEDDFFDDIDKLPSVETINLILGEPIPDTPELVDYHYMPPNVFSDKVADVLGAMELYKTQLFEAKINHNGKITSGYKIFHIHNEIQCMHMERSVYEFEVSSYAVEKLSLDEDILSEIDEELRLVFRLEEKSSKELYHEKVVNKLAEVNPVGLQFIRLDEWDIGSAFR